MTFNPARIDRNGDYVATDEEADLTRAEETRRLRRQHSYRGEQGPSDSRGRYQREFKECLTKYICLTIL